MADPPAWLGRETIQVRVELLAPLRDGQSVHPNTKGSRAVLRRSGQRGQYKHGARQGESQIEREPKLNPKTEGSKVHLDPMAVVG